MSAGPSAALSRRPPPALPITVLTGFLGAGKTTLLNSWVKTPAFADAAVVINEFGAVAIDHLLVEQAEGTMLTLSSGCLCCSVRGDLIETLEDLIRRRDNGRIAPFNRLVIETTGLADPGPVLNAVMAHPYLPLRYRVESVVTVVDALHGLATLERYEEARKQVAVADLLILSKSDLSPQGRVAEALDGRLRALNPVARRLDAARGEADAETVLAAGLAGSPRLPNSSAAQHPEASVAHPGHDHDHHADHDHDHLGTIRSTCLTSERPLDGTTLQMFMDLLRGTHGPKLLRIKGLVGLAEDPEHPLAIHAVQHMVHPARRLPAWPDGDRRTRVVFITDGLDPNVIEALWSGFFGGPAVDRPDAAAHAEAASSHGRHGLLAS